MAVMLHVSVDVLHWPWCATDCQLLFENPQHKQKYFSNDVCTGKSEEKKFGYIMYFRCILDIT